MTDLLRSNSFAVPVGSAWFALGTTAVAIALTVGGSTSATMTRASLAPRAAGAASIQLAATAVTPRMLPAPLEAQPGKTEAYFVFNIDGTPYLRIADLEDATVARHTNAPLRLVQKDGAVFSFAPLEAREVPAPYRSWAGQKIVAGESCHATITGLAVVSQLVGDAAYADLEGDWTAENAFEQGHPMIAARLDGCAEHTLARLESARPFVIPTIVEDARLAATARRTVLASATASAAQNRWVEGGGEGRWQDHAAFDVRMMKHPGTGTTWVVVFVKNEVDDCGIPEVNLLSTFQVGSNGKLRPISSGLVAELHALEWVLDLDGDGELELVGEPWLGLDRLITDGKGEVQDRLEVPFFGCPC
jgi:hypothetical protein